MFGFCSHFFKAKVLYRVIRGKLPWRASKFHEGQNVENLSPCGPVNVVDYGVCSISAKVFNLHKVGSIKLTMITFK